MNSTLQWIVSTMKSMFSTVGHYFKAIRYRHLLVVLLSVLVVQIGIFLVEDYYVILVPSELGPESYDWFSFNFWAISIRLLISGCALFFLGMELYSINQSLKASQELQGAESKDGFLNESIYRSFQVFFPQFLWIIGLLAVIFLAWNVPMEPGSIQALNLFGGNIQFEQEKIEKELENQDKRIETISNDTQLAISSLVTLHLKDAVNGSNNDHGKDAEDGERKAQLENFLNRIRGPLKDSNNGKGITNRHDVIIVGCQRYTEQRILCAIVTEALQRHFDNECGEDEYKVIPKYDYGSAARNFLGLIRGEIDVYPVYTWTGLEMGAGSYLSELGPEIMTLLEEDREKEGDHEKEEVKKLIRALNQYYGQALFWPKVYFGFKDDWELVIRREDANQVRGQSNLNQGESGGEQKQVTLKNLIKSGKLEHMVLGCDRVFYMRGGGYESLESHYEGKGFRLKNIKFMDRSQLYKALRNGEVDIINGFSTDPEITDPEFSIISDDAMGLYYAVPVIRGNLPQKDEVEHALKILNALDSKCKNGKKGITKKQMSDWIKQADRVPEGEHRQEHLEIVKRIAKTYVNDLDWDEEDSKD